MKVAKIGGIEYKVGIHGFVYRRSGVDWIRSSLEPADIKGMLVDRPKSEARAHLPNGELRRRVGRALKDGPLSARALAAACAVPIGTIHNNLGTLYHSGYVERTGKGLLKLSAETSHG